MMLKEQAVARMEAVPALVDYWFPLLDVPIAVYLNGERVLVKHERYPDTAFKRDGRLFFRLPSSESVASISGKLYGRRGPSFPPLSQDGIRVADVPPPLRGLADHRLLRQRGVTIDLRGDDRVPLDLSRNLPEGGASSLWPKLIPRIWGGLFRHGLKYKDAVEAVGQLFQADFETSKGEACYWLGPKERRTNSDGRSRYGAASEFLRRGRS